MNKTFVLNLNKLYELLWVSFLSIFFVEHFLLTLLNEIAKNFPRKH